MNTNSSFVSSLRYVFTNMFVLHFLNSDISESIESEQFLKTLDACWQAHCNQMVGNFNLK